MDNEINNEIAEGNLEYWMRDGKLNSGPQPMYMWSERPHYVLPLPDSEKRRLERNFYGFENGNHGSNPRCQIPQRRPLLKALPVGQAEAGKKSDSGPTSKIAKECPYVFAFLLKDKLTFGKVWRKYFEGYKCTLLVHRYGNAKPKVEGGHGVDQDSEVFPERLAGAYGPKLDIDVNVVKRQETGWADTIEAQAEISRELQKLPSDSARGLIWLSESDVPVKPLGELL